MLFVEYGRKNFLFIKKAEFSENFLCDPSTLVVHCLALVITVKTFDFFFNTNLLDLNIFFTEFLVKKLIWLFFFCPYLYM